jgi:hypothetical protein
VKGGCRLHFEVSAELEIEGVELENKPERWDAGPLLGHHTDHKALVAGDAVVVVGYQCGSAEVAARSLRLPDCRMTK